MHSSVTVSEAEHHILDTLSPLHTTEYLPLADTSGRILAADLTADRDYPPYDRCMMDGICFSSHALPQSTFPLLGTLHAGDPPPTSISENTAWRINTGAALPTSCDTVVPVEELTFSEDTVSINPHYQPIPRQFIHTHGSDVHKGDVILNKGTLIHAATLSIMASIGVTKVPVHRHPRVFILTTGKEAVPPHATPNAFQIRRSHATALQGALARLGITTVTATHLADDLPLMERTLAHALSEYDVIITCGAISKGSSDFLASILRRQISSPLFHGISQRPGKPMAFWSGTAHTPPVFALPGNALSTLITFHRYVAPALRTLIGQPIGTPPAVTVTHDLRPFHLTRFLPVTLRSPSLATLVNPKNSGDFAPLAQTNGFVEIPLGTPPASPTTLSYYPWL